MGRSFSGGGTRHIIEPHTSDLDIERHQFMHDVALYLHGSLEKLEYDKLMLIAPPKILGMIRKELSDDVQKTIILEINKDFLPLSEEQVKLHIKRAMPSRASA